MRTHAVPIPASANGSTSERDGDQRDADPRAARVLLRIEQGVHGGSSGAVADALAQQAGRPEDEHGDQHQEREHVLVVAAEQREVGVGDAALGDRVGPATTAGTGW